MLKTLQFSRSLLAKRSFSTLVSLRAEVGAGVSQKSPLNPVDGSTAFVSSVDIEKRLSSIVASYKKIGTYQTTRSPYQEEEDRSPYELTMSKMLAAGLHLGSSTKLWNARNLPFLFGERAGIHIFNLEITMAYLRRACAFTREVAYNGGVILFLSSKPEFAQATVAAAHRCGGYYIFDKWVPGTITNREFVLTPEVKQDRNGDPVFKTYKPDLLIIANCADNKTAIAEATRKNVPTIALIDSDQDPLSVTYPIPGNDDSVRGIELVMALLSSAAREGIQKRELEYNSKKTELEKEALFQKPEVEFPPTEEELLSLEP